MTAATGGAVVWFTGMPAAGKTTLAQNLVEWLRAQGQLALLLDSDVLREILMPETTYTEPERADFYKVLGALAAELAGQGAIAVVAATANRRRYRESARQLASNFIEIYVACDEATRKARDPKGLYAAAAAGKIKNLPGDDALYEPPIAPDITIDTTYLKPDEALAILVRQLGADQVLAGRLATLS